MSKRAAATDADVIEGQSWRKARPSSKDGLGSSKRPSLPPNTNEEIGEFEDEWEDEMESDDEVVDHAAEELDNLDLEDNVLPAVEEEDEPAPEPQIFLPGSIPLAEDEVLEPDQTVYEMLHRMNVAWPCLSFDILRDALGNDRRRYPATAFVATGTQADVASKNELLVMKMSQLHKTQRDDGTYRSHIDDSPQGADDVSPHIADSDSEDLDDDNEVDEDAVLEYRSIPHQGGVNRVRAQYFPESVGLPPATEPYYVATWADTGRVHVWDVRPLIESLDVPGYQIEKTRASRPVYSVTTHKKAEGFALDWSPHFVQNDASSLKFLSGDTHAKIFLTVASPSGFSTSSQPFSSHTSSIEDLQWSPSEQTVFASCSADRSVRVWDTRVKGKTNVVGVSAAHDSDVNVISWNKTTSHLLASGGDEGGIKIWDLRSLKGMNSTQVPVASFKWHAAPITSIEWHPSEDSIFAASGADEQVTLWDLSVEQDDDETGMQTDDSRQGGNNLKDVPPQLLFVHQGQHDIKEVHWHPQIPGAVVTTAVDGFNIFKTISV